MTDINPSFNPRRYRDYKLEKEGTGLNPYYINVFHLDKVQGSSSHDLSNNPLENPQYVTSAYKSIIEAFADAYGWIDCIYRDKTDPDSYEKAYNKLREDKQELYRYPYLNEQEFLQKEDNGEWEHAYKKGWEKNLINENMNN